MLLDKANTYLPGGVNSPVRAFRAVGAQPVFFERGLGAWIFDTEQKPYLDYVGAWGPAILGHAHPLVVAAITETASKGLGFGASNPLEVALAEWICTHMPSMEKVRLVNSGTEACMSAVRLARGYTGKEKIIKFGGCYHGHADSVLVEAGSGVLTHGLPSSAGVPAAFAASVLVAEYNAIETAARCFEMVDDIACVIVEPVAGNMGCVPPKPEFLLGLRRLCDTHGALLIFDEVMTGFRLSLGGAQAMYGVHPDLTTVGKVIGGGMPCAAFGGSAVVMDYLAPDGPVYQAGTLSGNPVSVVAGLKTVELIAQDPDFYTRLNGQSALLAEGIRAAAKKTGLPLCVNQVGSMLSIFFTDQDQVVDYASVKRCDVARFAQFFQLALSSGIYWPPSAFESCFLGITHDQEVIDETLKRLLPIFDQMA